MRAKDRNRPILYRKKPHMMRVSLLVAVIYISGIFFLTACAGIKKTDSESYVIHNKMDSDRNELAEYAGDVREDWLGLAASYGMTETEARQWYERFVQDGVCGTEEEYRFTGCAYHDFDENGEMDLLVIRSLSLQEMEPESAYYTIYGYINGKLAFGRDYPGISGDGFIKCEADKVEKRGICCNIQFIVDTESAEEQEYLISLNQQGDIIEEKCLTKSEQICHMLAQIPKEAYKTAISYEENVRNPLMGDGEVLIDEDTTADVRIFGYQDKYESGMIMEYQGVYSYFDFTWDSWRMQPKLYIGDFDKDSDMEIALVDLDQYGTGILVEGLKIFEVMEDKTLVCNELPTMPAYLIHQLGQYIHLDKAKGKVEIIWEGKTLQEIDLTTALQYEEYKDKLGVVYTNQITFEVIENRIIMKIEVLGETDVAWVYMSGIEDNVVDFEVIYKDNDFVFQPFKK